MKPAFSILFLLLSSQLICQTQGKKYADGHGGSIFLPLGDLSFADEVVEFKRGDPDAITEACDSTQLYVSKDGKEWINAGAISGGVIAVDMGDSVKKGEVFHYVKLVDLKTDCKGSWPGADIDAIAAIGSGKQISISNGVLYMINEYKILPGAKTELDSIAKEIKLQKPSEVVIEGHTDNTGIASQNKLLSEKRANAVKEYLLPKITPLKIKIRTIGYGSALPLASNETKDGQNRNRRVSIILIP